MLVLAPLPTNIKSALEALASEIWAEVSVAYRVKSLGGLTHGQDCYLLFHGYEAGEEYSQDTRILDMGFRQCLLIDWESSQPVVTSKITVSLRGQSFILRQQQWYDSEDEPLIFAPIPDADKFLQFEEGSRKIIADLIGRVLTNPVSLPD